MPQNYSRNQAQNGNSEVAAVPPLGLPFFHNIQCFEFFASSDAFRMGRIVSMEGDNGFQLESRKITFTEFLPLNFKWIIFRAHWFPAGSWVRLGRVTPPRNTVKRGTARTMAARQVLSIPLPDRIAISRSGGVSLLSRSLPMKPAATSCDSKTKAENFLQAHGKSHGFGGRGRVRECHC